MRLRLLLPIVALLGTAGSVEAGIRDAFKKPSSFPKPISLIDDRVERSAAATRELIKRHPPGKYSGAEWGSRFDQIKNNYPPRPLAPFLMRRDY